MDEQKLAGMRRALEERRAEIERDIEAMSDEIRSFGPELGEPGGVGNHMAEDGSDMMEAERLATISDDLREILAQVNGALSRMDDGTFGICQRCGNPINQERLEAFPYVTYCITCQTKIEREQALRAGR